MNEEENRQDSVLPNEESTTENNDALANVNAAWEERERAMRDEYEKRIAERDALIKQLIKGGGDSIPTDTIVDKINRGRNYKKW